MRCVPNMNILYFSSYDQFSNLPESLTPYTKLYEEQNSKEIKTPLLETSNSFYHFIYNIITG
jgi:hypothetical protein